MHVVRRISAAPVYRAPASVGRFDAPRSDYAGYTPGDVQVRQPPAVPQTVPSRPPATSTTPVATPRDACAALWTALIAGSPPYIQTCLAHPAHREQYDKICLLMAGNQISPASAASMWGAYVAQTCPVPQTPIQPPPPPAYVPTVPPPPPEDLPPVGMPGGPTDWPGGPTDMPPGDDVIDTPGTTTEEQAGYLRQVGSIVGIGLILAVGLTYARKKGMLKLTKRRSRR